VAKCTRRFGYAKILTNSSSLGYLMPTVFTIFGLRVVIYPNDHRPAHVHVIGRGCEVVFELNCPIGALTLRENYGFSKKDLTQIALELSKNHTALCNAWRNIHDYY
jgi:hypothetical protein